MFLTHSSCKPSLSILSDYRRRSKYVLSPTVARTISKVGNLFDAPPITVSSDGSTAPTADVTRGGRAAAAPRGSSDVSAVALGAAAAGRVIAAADVVRGAGEGVADVSTGAGAGACGLADVTVPFEAPGGRTEGVGEAVWTDRARWGETLGEGELGSGTGTGADFGANSLPGPGEWAARGDPPEAESGAEAASEETGAARGVPPELGAEGSPGKIMLGRRMMAGGSVAGPGADAVAPGLTFRGPAMPGVLRGGIECALPGGIPRGFAELRGGAERGTGDSFCRELTEAVVFVSGGGE